MIARSAAVTPAAIHASAVVIGEAAVILRGPPGVGKTALALALVEAATARGRFAKLVADDRVMLRRAGERLIVAPHSAIAGRVERRFVGLDDITHEDEAVARLVVDLAPAREGGLARMPGEAAGWTIIAGVRLRRLAFPAAHHHAVEAILHHLPGFAA